MNFKGELEQVYVLTKSMNTVQKWDKLDEDDEYIYVIPPHTINKIKKSIVFDDKKSAQYELFKYRVLYGADVSNFKGSKYYTYYLERAREENPELLV
jgi:hypothetical protein